MSSLLILGKPAVIFLPCGHTWFRITFYTKVKCYCYYESYMNHSGIKLLSTDLKTIFSNFTSKSQQDVQCHKFIPNELTENSVPCFFPGACTRKSLSSQNPGSGLHMKKASQPLEISSHKLKRIIKTSML